VKGNFFILIKKFKDFLWTQKRCTLKENKMVQATLQLVQPFQNISFERGVFLGRRHGLYDFRWGRFLDFSPRLLAIFLGAGKAILPIF
jgi:hypothetical protein